MEVLQAVLQPDQQPARWNDHVTVYETVFEPLTNQFARDALDRLALADGDGLLDIGAGTGGTALMAADRGLAVTAIDASDAMTARIAARAAASSIAAARIVARCMDGAALALPDDAFDAVISLFGVVLFPDAGLGMREAYRVLKPGGRIAIVTWTQPEKYELAARLMRAAASVLGEQPRPSSLPAQLRFREESAFRGLFRDAGFRDEKIATLTASWRLPSARWIAERIAFAPGMAAMVDGFGPRRDEVLAAFITQTEQELGRSGISLSAMAFLGLAEKPAA